MYYTKKVLLFILLYIDTMAQFLAHSRRFSTSALKTPPKLNTYSKILTNDPSLGAAKAMYYALGFKKEDFSKAQIGIGSMAYDGNPCNSHLGKLSDVVHHKMNLTPTMKGLRFNTIGVSDGIGMGTKGMRYSLPSREIIADSIQTITEAHHYDGNVIIGSCDKNLPGALMAISRINRPSILVYGGSMKPGFYKNKPVDIVSAFQSYGQLLSGEMSENERDDLLEKCCPGPGTCAGGYTANSMGVFTEALGMCLPNSSSNLAESNEKISECESVSNYMELLLRKNIKPSDIITRKSIENGITAVIAFGGSTNIVLHVLALARTIGIDLTIDDFNKIGAKVPVFGNIKPYGQYVMADIYNNGGTSVLLKSLLDGGFLHPDCSTVTGKTLAENLTHIKTKPNKDIWSYDNPVKSSSHIRVLRGSLAPNGAVAKITGKEGEYFEGYARVYDTEDAFINDLKANLIKENMVIVIRYQGPKGSPGMPEMLKATSAVVGCGLAKKICFLTDGRFSGGTHGFVIGHISQEAYEGGPIALIENGDKIIVDAKKNTIDLIVDSSVLFQRKMNWVLPEHIKNNVEKYGFLSKYRKLVQSASDGCVLE